MSPLMKIGRFVFPSLLPVCCFSRGNGCAHQLTPKTLFRKRSFAFGGAIITLKTAPCFMPRFDPSPSIFFAATTAGRDANLTLSLKSNTPFSQNSRPKMKLSGRFGPRGRGSLMPNEQREVVVMKIWNELTFADIGTVLGISQNTAASRYRYALGALRKNFAPHNERLSELESELRKLRPTPPSPELFRGLSDCACRCCRGK